MMVHNMVDQLLNICSSMNYLHKGFHHQDKEYLKAKTCIYMHVLLWQQISVAASIQLNLPSVDGRCDGRDEWVTVENQIITQLAS